ncbi:hypothetical protein AVEN_53484-1 [Araneus ventricosus]|uniref:Uncharacterized protein n=1 Tax=Araneus ventricosus TaxID=182803 RepID=A0A4Y2ACY9_ARAVE|nr:hypothetical protein AVEN_53484-1 [Araneus ventricosus]
MKRTHLTRYLLSKLPHHTIRRRFDPYVHQAYKHGGSSGHRVPNLKPSGLETEDLTTRPPRTKSEISAGSGKRRIPQLLHRKQNFQPARATCDKECLFYRQIGPEIAKKVTFQQSWEAGRQSDPAAGHLHLQHSPKDGKMLISGRPEDASRHALRFRMGHLISSLYKQTFFVLLHLHTWIMLDFFLFEHRVSVGTSFSTLEPSHFDVDFILFILIGVLLI